MNPVLDLTVGGEDPHPAAAFARPPDLFVTPGGDILALEVGQPQVPVFSREGQFIRFLGREGDGPGEFRRASGLGFLADTIWVRNVPQPRVSLFQANGAHIYTFSQAVSLGEGYRSPLGITHLVLGGWRVVSPANPPVTGPGGLTERVPVPVVLVSEGGAVVDTLSQEVLPNTLFIPPVAFWNIDAFPLQPLNSISQDGSQFLSATWDPARPGLIDLHRVTFPERIEETLTVELPEPSLDPGRVDQRVDEIGREVGSLLGQAARVRGDRPPKEVEEKVRAGLAVQDPPPVVDRVLVGIDHTIWLRLFSLGQQKEWLAFDSRAHPLFSVILPERLQVSQASATTVWGVLVNELDVPCIVRYRLVRQQGHTPEELNAPVVGGLER